MPGSARIEEKGEQPQGSQVKTREAVDISPIAFGQHGSLLKKKQRERSVLVSFRMPQSLKDKLELAAQKHEVNQTDLINEAIDLNLQRYL
ncbi:hypothetical protein D1Y84_00615 [Acidipila sp. EB88]|nr:hypothetical protein D1Y84_00615 [Acidipila sp. EB88]